MSAVLVPGDVLVDYTPLPDGIVKDVFDVENALAQLRDGDSIYSFYPPTVLEAGLTTTGMRLCQRVERHAPMPWSRDLLPEHATLAKQGQPTSRTHSSMRSKPMSMTG